jgi:hypothetical protein
MIDRYLKASVANSASEERAIRHEEREEATALGQLEHVRQLRMQQRLTLADKHHLARAERPKLRA